METVDFNKFYFDDKAFVTLCRQLEKEIKGLDEWTEDNAYDLLLVYQKFELYLSVYYQSSGRDDIDYKTQIRKEIGSEIHSANHPNIMNEEGEEHHIHKNDFKDAREKLLKVIEDIIYQAAWKESPPKPLIYNP